MNYAIAVATGVALVALWEIRSIAKQCLTELRVINLGLDTLRHHFEKPPERN